MEHISKALEPLGTTEPAILYCAKHGEYSGFTCVVAGQKIKSQCDHCAAEEWEAEKLRISEENEIARRAEMRKFKETQSSIPPRFKKKSFKDWQPACATANEVKGICGRFVTGFNKALEEGTSYLFSGPSATGKTSMACAIGNNLLMRGHSVIYVSQLEYVSAVKDSWKDGSKVSENDLIERYAKPDLLILDEIGKGNFSPKEKGFVHMLLDKRYMACKPTIGISNLSEDALSKVLDKETVRRLKAGGGEVLGFQWKPFE